MTLADYRTIHDERGDSIETIIRVAKGPDARAILGLFNHVERETPFLSFDAQGQALSLKQEAQLIEAYDQAPSSIMIVAEVDDQIIGLANVSQLPGSKQGHVAEVGVCVIKEYWHYGIGSILVKESINFAQSTDLRVLTLEVVRENHRAIQLYERFGFKQVGALSQRIQSGLQYYDTFIMEKIIK